MKKIYFSRLEAQIIKYRIFICALWLIVASFYVYFFIVHWILGLFFLCLLPLIGVLFYQERFYFPFSKDYFHLIKTREMRESIAKQFESFNSIRIGELYFFEEFVLFSKWGAAFQYHEIAALSNQKTTIGRASFRQTAYILKVCLKNGKIYCLTIQGSEAACFEVLYRKAIDFFCLKTANQDKP